jgi:hypothetical protein
LSDSIILFLFIPVKVGGRDAACEIVFAEGMVVEETACEVSVETGAVAFAMGVGLDILKVKLCACVAERVERARIGREKVVVSYRDAVALERNIGARSAH